MLRDEKNESLGPIFRFLLSKQVEGLRYQMNYVTVYIDLIVICILSMLLIVKVDACIFYGPF